MVEINASREISAPLDRVWNIIMSDINGEPRYWRDLAGEEKKKQSIIFIVITKSKRLTASRIFSRKWMH
jgi:hypothetical protein